MGNFDDQRVMESKIREVKNWDGNKMFVEVKDVGQKVVNTSWVVTEKVKDGETICKARLVARGFEEEMKDMETDAPTCAPETLKLCITRILQEEWTVRRLDVKAAFLQGKEIERVVYLRPPKEENCNGLWKLRKTVYGLKDAAVAWYKSVVNVMEDLGGTKSKLDSHSILLEG